MALIGVGHLVGMAVGIAMLVGLIISCFVLVPWQTGLAGLAAAADLETLVVDHVFREKVRFIGAGTIGVAAIWTLLKIIGPIVKGVTSALAASRARRVGGRTASTSPTATFRSGSSAGPSSARSSPSGCCCRPSPRAARSPPRRR